MSFTVVAHLTVKPESVDAVKSKLVEAAGAYRTDQGTLGWHVYQDVKTPTKFTLVERYENKGSLKHHTANPAFAKFGPWMKPHLVGEIQLLFNNELVPDVPNQIEGPAKAKL